MGWQDDARRTVVSDKRNLTTMPGYWVKVRKWSITGKDEIDEATKEAQKSLDRKALFEIGKTIKGLDAEKVEAMTVDELLPLLTTDQFAALMDSQSTQSARLIEVKLKNGIDSHNFCEGDIDTRSTDKDIKGFAHQILEYPEIAEEILVFVEAFNRPLARATSSTSGMSPNGSTEGRPSSMGTPSPTDEALPN